MTIAPATDAIGPQNPTWFGEVAILTSTTTEHSQMKHIRLLCQRVVRLALLCLAFVPAGSSFATSSFLFSETGALTTARAYHTATLLPDGKVLASGGNTGVTVTATTELYDPATGIWTPTGSMSQGRCRHSATLLPNGLVLIVGGQVTGDGLTSAELYDPATGTWSATGALAEGRSALTTTLLPDGRVLAAGGGGTGGTGPLASAEIYDPATGVWTQTGRMRFARFRHDAR